MKGNPQVIELLNARLSEELAAISQYMVHAGMCANWGYARLAAALEDHAKQEMRHTERLIARVIFLEGVPSVARVGPIRLGQSVQDMVINDHHGELEAVHGYNEGIELCTRLADNGTRELLQEILQDEEGHVDWLEAQRDQLEHMGVANYLALQAQT